MKDFSEKCNPNRPLLKYPGSKWRVAPWVVSFFPEHKTYVEPYGGGGSVLLRKPAVRREVYNDLDDELFNLFTVLRTKGKQLCQQVKLTPFSRREFEQAFRPTRVPMELYAKLYRGWKTRDMTTRAVSNKERTERVWIKP